MISQLCYNNSNYLLTGGIFMETGKDVPIREIIAWQDKQAEGFHGILTNPRGEQGFLSKIGGSTSWTPIGEGQDEVEVMRAAKQLHEAMSSPSRVDPDLLRYLGEEVERLSRPKPKKA